MFVNHYEHSLDSKHRLVLPAKFRGKLGDRVYLALQDNSLAVYSETAFEEATERLLDQVRSGEADPQTRLAFASNTVEIEIDSAGRITIPQRLREFANLTGDVIVAGALTHVELWDRDAYQSIESALTDVVHEQFKAGGRIN
jgi:MraZ protein